MTRDEFWDHVRATRRKDPDAHAERLTRRLAKFPADEIIDAAPRLAATYLDGEDEDDG
jgi:hypothetical protein